MDIRSGCPINLSVEVLGDRWSLVVLRDIMFGNLRTYRELHGNSLEGIATNILASRLRRLEAEGFITGAPDPAHKQRTIYSLTEKAIALVPVMAALGSWGVRYAPADRTFAARSIALEKGGAPMWAAFVEELRHFHLGAPQPERSVLAELNAAYEAAVAQEAGYAVRSPSLTVWSTVLRAGAPGPAARPLRRSARTLGRRRKP